MGQSMSPNKYYAASEPPNMCGGTSKYVGESYRSICPSLLLIYSYMQMQPFFFLKNIVWFSISYLVEKVSGILLIIVSVSHKRNTRMVQIWGLAAGNCIGMRFLHSASLQSK